METNIAPGLRFSILDREFKKKLEERANRMGLTAVQLRVLGELSRAESMGACEINQMEERRVGKECRSRWSPYH